MKYTYERFSLIILNDKKKEMNGSKKISYDNIMK